MLTKLQVKGFKSWADTGELRIAPLTGLFGTNSSGKTSILQALLMLKQTAESPDRTRVLHTGDERSLVDLGTYFDVVHRHETGDVPLSVSLSWGLRQPLKVRDPERKSELLFETDTLSFDVETRGEEAPEVESFRYSFAENQFGMSRKASGSGNAKRKYELEHGNYHPRRVQGRPWPLPQPVKCYGFPDEAVGYYQNMGFLPSFPLAFEEMCASMAYLGPLRDYPKRSYVWAGERPTDVGRRGELAVPALLASRAKGQTISRGRGKSRQTVEERVAEWLADMGMIHSFSLRQIAENRKDYEVLVRRSRSAAEVLITDVGFGVSQMLPVLVLCYYVPKGAILLLEQPEIHLHPSVQSVLADVLIDAVTTRGVQIIVESHSEHLLRRLQRRIAEEAIGHGQTALYFCRMDGDASTAEPLDVDMCGNIRNWPQDFFGDDVGDLVAMTEAAAKRQGAQ